jgi:signal transduction histidine kinase
MPLPSAAEAAAPARRPRWDWRAVDWRVVFMLFPRRRFTAEELQRAVPPAPNPTLVAAIGVNALLLLAVFAFWGRREASPVWFLPVVALVAAVLIAAGTLAWRNPSSTAARWVYFGAPLLAGLALGLGLGGGEARLGRPEVFLLWLTTLTGTLALWFVIVHRHQYIELRLRELAERERAIEMAQRLAAAQIEPHFLFNTLASLQHWVQTQDPRAASLLEALIGYLRATLPMFSRALQPAADELEAVRRYLQVMQARLGARLVWSIEVEPALQAQPLPPGLLLTLVENAIVHAVEPALAGGTVRVRGRRDGAAAVFTVHDTGPGPGPGAAEGTGLSNCRERLALTQGAAARLTLNAAPEGGCVAELRLPLAT